MVDSNQILRRPRDGEIRKYPDESSGLLLLASDIGLCTERRLYQSLCLPAGVPSDQFDTPTRNTRIGGSPFISDGSFDEKNQKGADMTGEPAAPEPQSLASMPAVKNIR